MALDKKKWRLNELNGHFESLIQVYLRANFNLGKVNKSVFDMKCRKQDRNITDATQLDAPKM